MTVNDIDEALDKIDKYNRFSGKLRFAGRHLPTDTYEVAIDMENLKVEIRFYPCRCEWREDMTKAFLLPTNGFSIGYATRDNDGNKYQQFTYEAE